MILSNVEILRGLQSGYFSIENLAGLDPAESPFNTSAVDLRLGSQIAIPNKDIPVQMDLRVSKIARFLDQNSRKITITEDQPFTLKPHTFILGQTLEKVDFPILGKDFCFSARVEGKSSIARCGIIVHFTAPTIHAGFSGTITLEMINLGPIPFLLFPGMFICQLIIEQVLGNPISAPNQFSGQMTPTGVT